MNELSKRTSGPNRLRHNAIALCTAIGLWVGILPCHQHAAGADSLATLFGDPVLVKGEKVEVKRSQLDEAFIAYRANLAARGEDIKPADRPQKEVSLLERIVLTQIIEKIATTADRTNATALAERFLADARKLAGGTEEGFARQLRSLGLSVDQFSKRVFEQSLVETLLERELKSSVKITGEDVNKFYTDNPERFQQPDVAKGQHIVAFLRDPRTGVDLPPDQIRLKRERLLRAQARAKTGEDFLTLVREYSEDPEAIEKKGEFAISKIGRLPEIEGAAFTLPLNAISDIISTPNALHVLRVSERIPAKQVELEKAKGDIEKFIAHREMEKKLPEFFAKLKSEAKLEVLDPKFKAVLDRVSPESFVPALGGK